MPVSPDSTLPRVSVVIPSNAGASLARAVHVLREQTLTDWQAVVAGEAVDGPLRRLIGGDPRFTLRPAPGPAHEAINAAFAACRGEFVTVLDPRDFLTPEALESLVAAAADGPAAYGGYVFHGPLGVLPTDPLTGALRGAARGGQAAPAEIGLAELAECKLFPLHAMVVRRERLAGALLRRPIELGGDHDWLLQLAQRGVSWRACVGPEQGAGVACLAAVAMDEPGDPGAILAALAAHAGVIGAALRTLGAGPPDHRRVLHDHAEAAVLLNAFGRDLERLTECPGPGAGGEGGAGGGGGGGGELVREFLGRTEFGNLFAQWWARLRFLGRPPRHVLAASGSVERWARSSARQIAERLLAGCEPGRPIVLLGLGRNARELCRVLRRLELPIVGRDDGLTAPPGWAREDGLTVRMLHRDEPWDPQAEHVMTLSRDEDYLARLPRGLRVIRWAEAPERLASEALAHAAERLAEGRTDIDPPAPAPGAFAALRPAPAGLAEAAR